jgi:RimJ/RimL family protein N-acetyltransferase
VSNSYRRHPLIEERGLLSIRANRFGSNHASGRVLRKIGMVHLHSRPGYDER